MWHGRRRRSQIPEWCDLTTDSLANWGFNLIVAVTFLDLVAAVGSANAFVVYAVLSVVALIFVFVEVPETKGHTLEQIELDFERMATPRAA